MACKFVTLPYSGSVAIASMQSAWERGNDARPGSMGLDGGGMR